MIRTLIKNNQIISHLGANYLGNYVGYNIGHILTRSDPLVKIVNGYLVGFGMGIACNIGLYYYTRYLDQEALDNNNKDDEGKDEKEMEDEEDVFANLVVNEIIEYYCGK
ncbi:MAG: hypothetical protein WD512_16950 [Candidatus Paceibacterota bacterium]